MEVLAGFVIIGALILALFALVFSAHRKIGNRIVSPDGSEQKQLDVESVLAKQYVLIVKLEKENARQNRSLKLQERHDKQMRSFDKDQRERMSDYHFELAETVKKLDKRMKSAELELDELRQSALTNPSPRRKVIFIDPPEA